MREQNRDLFYKWHITKWPTIRLYKGGDNKNMHELSVNTSDDLTEKSLVKFLNENDVQVDYLQKDAEQQGGEAGE